MTHKKSQPKTKNPQLHPRNKHQGHYDFQRLIAACPTLAPYVKPNQYNNDSIDFFNPQAVKMLNKALLKYYYNIEHWDIPKNYLCPPIPGRADYIHHIADALGSFNHRKIPKGIRCLDIGIGANCVYPIIGNQEYGWSFVGSDIDAVAVQSANQIVELNPKLKGQIELRLQANSKDVFKGIIRQNEYLDLSICNPPFHASAKDAQAGTLRKLKNLKQEKVKKTVLNFGGQHHELWCEGGEKQFVQNMIVQSKDYATNCFLFSTLISKQEHLKSAYATLKKVNAVEVKTIPMGQGNKISRILAWTFLSPKQQKIWAKARF